MTMTVARPTIPTAQPPATPVTAPREAAAIRTERLNAWYGTTHAVGDVTFEIPGRSVTAIRSREKNGNVALPG